MQQQTKKQKIVPATAASAGATPPSAPTLQPFSTNMDGLEYLPQLPPAAIINSKTLFLKFDDDSSYAGSCAKSLSSGPIAPGVNHSCANSSAFSSHSSSSLSLTFEVPTTFDDNTRTKSIEKNCENCKGVVPTNQLTDLGLRSLCSSCYDHELIMLTKQYMNQVEFCSYWKSGN
jgi:hypothetical protein